MTSNFNFHIYKAYCNSLNIQLEEKLPEIKRVFREKVKRLRPDINPESAKEFGKIKEAYDYLVEHNAKALTTLSNSRKYSQTKTRLEPDFDFLKSFHEHTDNLPTPPIELKVGIEFELCIFGGEKTLNVDILNPCGCLVYHSCPKCRQKGLVKENKRVSFKIPVGTSDQQVLTLKELGHYDLKKKKRGDIHLIVDMLPDLRNHFTKINTDLHLKLEIDYTQAILGKLITIPTLEGFLRYNLRQGTQNNSKEVFKELGAYEFNDKYKRGDLVVSFIIKYDSVISEEEKELLEKIYELRKDKLEDW